ncbi:hypothetical protein [Sphingomonas pokkalii]|uniref:hypothetical protein n=1 Tax=Sphingomonas pokkalii TaxID=2175090 RepID=UPI0010580EAD|nr:hypothetical protein [Sphingomonas pokkalii]
MSFIARATKNDTLYRYFLEYRVISFDAAGPGTTTGFLTAAPSGFTIARGAWICATCDCPQPAMAAE